MIAVKIIQQHGKVCTTKCNLFKNENIKSEKLYNHMKKKYIMKKKYA